MEIDLVPDSYRLHLWQRRWLARCGISLAAGLVAAGVIASAFSLDLDRARDTLADLRRQHSERTEAARALGALRTEVTALRTVAERVRGLRDGPANDVLFVAIDHALVASPLEFERWQFERIADADDPRRGRMSLRGRAPDLAALGGFVDALLAEPGVQSARVLRTAAGADGVLTFDLDVLLGAPA